MPDKKKVKSVKDLRDKYKYKRKVKALKRDFDPKTRSYGKAKEIEVEYDEPGHFTDGGSAKELDKNLLDVARDKLKAAKEDIRHHETSIMKYSKKVPVKKKAKVKSVKDLRAIKKARDAGEKGTLTDDDLNRYYKGSK